MWHSEPVYGVGIEVASLTPDVCEVSTIGELTEEEGDDTMPVLMPQGVANGTCEVEVTVVDGSAEATLSFEDTDQ